MKAQEIKVSANFFQNVGIRIIITNVTFIIGKNHPDGLSAEYFGICNDKNISRKGVGI